MLTRNRLRVLLALLLVALQLPSIRALTAAGRGGTGCACSCGAACRCGPECPSCGSHNRGSKSGVALSPASAVEPAGDPRGCQSAPARLSPDRTGAAVLAGRSARHDLARCALLTGLPRLLPFLDADLALSRPRGPPASLWLA